MALTEPIGYLIRGGLRSDDRAPSENLADLVHASELDPDNRVIWDLLSDAYLVEKRFDDSLVAAERLVSVAPEVFGAYEFHARAFYHVSKHAACIEDSNRSMQINPDHAIAWAMRGEAKVALGDTARAQQDFNQATLIAPENASFRLLLEKIFIG